MLRKRVIPILQIIDEKLVKSTKFKNHKYVGDPLNAVRIFNQKEVDEIIVIDVENYKKKKQINFDFINDLASECRMPFSYGGGISNMSDVEKLFNLGVEKITINTNVFTNYNFINEIAKNFGSQSIVISIDINTDIFNKKKIYNWRENKNLNFSINQHVKNCIDNGAGEILYNFVYREGTLQGFDFQSLDIIDEDINIPVIVNGGINSPKEIKEILTKKKIDACGIGALFIYYGPYNAVLISYLEEELEY